MGGLPTNLVEEFVYFEGRKRDGFKGVTSFGGAESEMFSEDMAIYFYTDRGIGALISRINSGQLGLLEFDIITKSASIYLDNRLVALLDGSNKSALKDTLSELSQVYTRYPLLAL